MSESREEYRARILTAVGPKSTERPEFQQGGGYGAGERPALDDIAPDAIEAEALREWSRSPELRAEFRGDREVYLAYCEASNAGLVKILGGVVVR